MPEWSDLVDGGEDAQPPAVCLIRVETSAKGRMLITVLSNHDVRNRSGERRQHPRDTREALAIVGQFLVKATENFDWETYHEA